MIMCRGNESKTYTLNELIEKLQKYVEAHGDKEVLYEDCDTDWYLPVGVTVHGEHVVITSSYYGDPEGSVIYE